MSLKTYQSAYLMGYLSHLFLFWWVQIRSPVFTSQLLLWFPLSRSLGNYTVSCGIHRDVLLHYSINQFTHPARGVPDTYSWAVAHAPDFTCHWPTSRSPRAAAHFLLSCSGNSASCLSQSPTDPCPSCSIAQGRHSPLEYG